MFRMHRHSIGATLCQGKAHITGKACFDAVLRRVTKNARTDAVQACIAKRTHDGAVLQPTTKNARTEKKTRLTKKARFAKKTRIVAAAAFVALLTVACPRVAFADITFYVGYAGGPFYEKATFTDAEIRAMSDGVLYEYSCFDAGNYLRKAYGRGVELDTLVLAAGIEDWDMWRFVFSTVDKYQDEATLVDGYGNTAWYFSTLLEGRFYFPDLISHFDFTTRTSIYDPDELWNTAVAVPTILAYESSFTRVFSEDDINWTNEELVSSSNAYRLLYGQTEPTVGDARNSAHSYQSVFCLIGGEDSTNIATIGVGELEVLLVEGALNGVVGETYTFMPTLDSSDETVSSAGVKDIVWVSTDENVFTVTVNEDGSVTLTFVGEGEAELCANYGESKYYAFMNTAYWGVSGGEGEGDDEGAGEEDAGNPTDGIATITFDPGTLLYTAEVSEASSTESSDVVSEEESTSLEEGGGDDPSSEDSFSITIVVTQEEVEEEIYSYQTTTVVPTELVYVLMGLLAFGCTKRSAQYGLALDRKNPKKRRRKKQGRKDV